jgi:hypothetical protein
LQRRLLANHHQMQVEMRAIVSRERFEFLRRRLANVVAPATAKPSASTLDLWSENRLHPAPLSRAAVEKLTHARQVLNLPTTT